jgi:hypothetical protein
VNRYFEDFKPLKFIAFDIVVWLSLAPCMGWLIGFLLLENDGTLFFISPTLSIIFGLISRHLSRRYWIHVHQENEDKINLAKRNMVNVS